MLNKIKFHLGTKINEYFFYKLYFLICNLKAVISRNRYWLIFFYPIPYRTFLRFFFLTAYLQILTNFPVIYKRMDISVQ